MTGFDEIVFWLIGIAVVLVIGVGIFGGLAILVYGVSLLHRNTNAFHGNCPKCNQRRLNRVTWIRGHGTDKDGHPTAVTATWYECLACGAKFNSGFGKPIHEIPDEEFQRAIEHRVKRG